MSSTLAARRVWAYAHIRRIAVSHPPPRARYLIAIVLGAVWMAFLLVRLFVPSTVGLADETDGHRYMCQRGLQAVRGTDYAALYWHVYTTYRTYTWYGETCGTYRGDETKYASSHEAVIWLGQQLNGLFGMPGALDLRTLAIIYALVIGLAIGLTFALLPGNLMTGLLTTIGIGLVYTESVIAVYFVSPYAEPTVWCGFALLLPALLWYWRAPRVSWPRLAVVVGISFSIITAKTQAIGYLPAILVALLWTRRSPLSRAAEPRSRWRAVRSNWRSITACVLLIGASGGYIASAGNLKVYSQLNVYEMVFTTLLPAGHDPAGDLRWMGADPALAYANGTSVIAGNGAAGDPRLLKFSRDVSQLTVMEFIATHPGRLLKLTGYGQRALGKWRPAYLGNYTNTSAHPGLEHECRDCMYYYLLAPARAKPVLFGFLLVFALLAGFWLRRAKFIPQSHRVMAKAVIFLATAAVGEFWLILLTQGIGDDVKHQVFTLLPIMLCLPTTAACIALGRRTEKVKSDEDDPGPSDEDDLGPSNDAPAAPTAARIVL